MNGKIYVITGPSGVGKSSIATELLRLRPNLKKIVTCTTRPKRQGEMEGVSYHFLDRSTFQQLIDKNELFEWDEHYGNRYGSRRVDVLALMEAGNDVLFVVDIAGAQTIKEKHPEAIVLFIEAESTEQLLNRLKHRDKGHTTGLAQRRTAIEQEVAFAPLADYRIVNREGELDRSVAEIIATMDA